MKINTNVIKLRRITFWTNMSQHGTLSGSWVAWIGPWSWIRKEPPVILLSRAPISILDKPCSTAPGLFDGQRGFLYPKSSVWHLQTLLRKTNKQKLNWIFLTQGFDMPQPKRLKRRSSPTAAFSVPIWYLIFVKGEVF